MENKKEKQKLNKISPLLRQPWSNYNEWKACYDLLFSNTYGAKTNTKINRIDQSLDSFIAGLNISNLQNARNVLNIWLIRNDSTNHTLITSLLVEEIIKILEGKYNITSDVNNDNKNILAQKIIRVTNLLIDDLKKKNRSLNSNMFLVAKEIELPEFIVEIRHSCTHKDLPSASTLLFVIKYLFYWIKENIWNKQYNLFIKEKELTEKTISIINFLNGNFKLKTFDSKLFELEGLHNDNEISFEVESLYKIIECFVNVIFNKILITNNAVLCENLKEFTKIFKFLQNIEYKLVSILFFKFFSDQIYFLLSEVLVDYTRIHLIKEKESVLKKFAFIANLIAQNASPSNIQNIKEDFSSLITNIHNNLSFTREFSVHINDIYNYFNICFKIKPDLDKFRKVNSQVLLNDICMDDYDDEQENENESVKTKGISKSSAGSLLFEQLDCLLNKTSFEQSTNNNNDDKTNQDILSSKNLKNEKKLNTEQIDHIESQDYYNYYDLYDGLIL